MLYLIQRGKVRSQVVNVPEGLPEILTDITREVLRCQPTPECMCQFIIDYLHSVDEIIGDLCICDIPKEKSEQMSLAMEECFKRFLTKRRCEKDRQSEVLKFKDLDVLDELIRKCKFNEVELEKSRQAIKEACTKFMDFYLLANADEDATEALYQHFRARELQRQVEKQQKEAAIKIQPPSFNIHTPDDQIIIKEELAARKIQKFFRDLFSRTYEKLTEEEQSTQTENIAVPEERKELKVDFANIRDSLDERELSQTQVKPITPTEVTAMDEESAHEKEIEE
uniref:Uncharacterized protein n=1 Tax=Glossina austeni TaxID=7395 RepID=A0A1A9UTP7_GLOAU